MKSINKTKKVLLIFADSAVRQGLADANKLRELLQAQADNQEVKMEVYVTYARSLSFFVSNTASCVYDHKNKMDLKDYDLVYFRKVGTVMQQMLACASYLRRHGVPFLDREIGFSNSRNKLSQMFLFHEAGLPVPTTLYCRNKKRVRRLLTETYREAFTWPVVAKATGGTRGDANYLLHTPEALVELLKSIPRHFLIQSFIPNDGDYRVLVMAGKLRGLIKRKGVEGSHLNNTSKQGSAKWLPVQALGSDLQILAIQAAQLCKRDIAGVDLLLDKTDGQPYILEVNRAPQIENASFPKAKADALVEAMIETMQEPVPDMRPEPTIIGRKEKVRIEELPHLGTIVAKVDTGAYSNSLHCPYIEERIDKQGRRVLHYSFSDDKKLVYTTEEYFTKKVTSSNGITEQRFVIELHFHLGKKKLAGMVSLTNRGSMQYPMLIGRRFLRQHNLIVNVAKRFSA